MRRLGFYCALILGALLVGCGEEPEPTPIKLDAPAELKAGEITTTTIAISWEAVENAEGYTWRCKTADSYTSGDTTECAVTLTDLLPATEYQIAVRATKGDSMSDFSEYITVTTAEEGGEEPEPNPDPEPEPENPPVVGSVPLDKLVGYGENTTGGQGGKVYHFNQGTAFRDWLKLREKNKSTEPAIVWLSGTFTAADGRDTGSPWFDIKRTSNITIYGTDSFRMDKVGFFLNEASNIIIRNVYIVQPKADNGADGISMQESQNVWVDHCTFESVNQTKDYEDGSCDVTHETNGVTISWCHYIKTQKSTLVGHSNSASADEKITITMHHNWFDGSSSRHPRVRFGRAHVYNNFYDNVTTYGVGSAYGAKVLVENNAFDGVRLPTDICTFPAKKSGSSWVSNLTGSVAGYLYAANNEYTNKPADASDPYPFTNVEYVKYNGEKLATPLTYNDFKPSYDYVVDDQTRVAEIVKSGAGVGRLTGFSSAPIEADNGGLGTEGGGSGDSGSEGGDDSGTTDPEQPSEPTGSDIGGGWTLTAVNGSEVSASVSAEGVLSLSATGKFESGAQKFGYVWRKLSGDFTLTVALDGYTTAKGGNQSAAGLMICSDPAASATDMLYMTSGVIDTDYYSHYRLTSGAKASKKSMGTRAAGDDVVLRLTRSGSSVEAAYSTDGGATFTVGKSDSFAALADEVYVGLVVSSGDNSTSATAQFSDMRIDGAEYGFN
ncbi:MAG: right-handed parallel beta-helix repeat-containing protein [Tidjanibacter sp.]|nr:right-handed parallel beta-helix repeat-containing protein [Tidjanibacter sp.]